MGPKPNHAWLRFTGKQLILHGKKTVSYPAASGNNAAKPIPKGHYFIYVREVSTVGPFTDELGKVATALKYRVPYSKVEDAHSNSWGNFRIPIHQSTKQANGTGRGGFFIHGGDHYSTAGCITLGHWMDVFVNDLRQENVSGALITLDVD